MSLIREIEDQHSGLIQKVASGWKNGSFSAHAILLTGPAGIGKREAGRLLAANFLSGGESILLGKNTPNYTEIGGESDESEAESERGDSIKIDQFRELKELARFAEQRVVHVPDAERMTAQAANSLLKLLEEPPRGWKFVLSSSDPNLLLPTLISRMQLVRLHPFSEAQLLAALERLHPEAQPQILRRSAQYAQGSLKRALEALDPDYQAVIGKIKAFTQNPWPSFAELVDLIAKSDRHFEILLTVLESDCASEFKRIVSTPQKNSSRRSHFVRISERLALARKQIRIPLNRKLLIQDILGEWAHPSSH